MKEKKYLDHPTIRIASKETAQALSDKLHELDLKKKEEIVKNKARKQHIPYISLIGFPIGPDTLGLVDEQTCRRVGIIPFYQSDDAIRIGAIDPMSLDLYNVRDELKKNFPRAKVEFFFISKHSFDVAIKLIASLPKIKPLTRSLSISQSDIQKFQHAIQSFSQLEQQLQTRNVTQAVAMLAAIALNNHSSDIHLETKENNLEIRFRIDGILHHAAKLPIPRWQKLLNRIKELAGIKINVTAVPQDGHITVESEDRVGWDIRVSTLPSAFGENVVLRLLRSTTESFDFHDLGFRDPDIELLTREIKRPNGMIITTGPTGSGKTTTLYAILKALNTSNVNIMTLEDPIEYKLEGIVQSQIDLSKSYTFPKGLRSLLRQDPDIIMIGEIRDLETAEIAIQASLTGHLVVTTIHANDSAGAIPRFLALGAKSFLLSPSINLVMAQRLVRKLCQHCKIPISLPNDIKERVMKILKELPPSARKTIDRDHLVFYGSKTCGQCHGIGYKGRIGIVEMFSMNKEIEQLILKGSVSEYEMTKVARNSGMVTMVEDGLIKALWGITSVDEVFRVSE